MSTSIHPTQALLAQASWLRALAVELVRDGGEAEDLAQEALLRALQHPPREPGALRGFLRSVLRNTSLQNARGESRRREREQRAAREESQPATDEVAQRLSLHRRVVEAVQRLDEPYRSAILLRFFDGLAPREIAARRGEPVKTVHTHIQRALERLRADFDREHGDARRPWARAFLPLLGAPRGRAPVPVAARSLPRLLRVIGTPSVALLAALGLVLWGIHAARQERGLDLRTSGATPAGLDAHASDIAALDSTDLASGREPIESERARRVSGRVRTSDAEPVAGARIEALSRPAATFEVNRGDFASAATHAASASSDALGRFALEVAGEQPWRLVASAAGLGTEILDSVRTGDEVEITLQLAARFEFSIVAGDDEIPCGGAHIVLLREGIAGTIFEGKADALGRVAIEALAPGVYSVEATPVEAQRVFAIDLVLRAGETALHVLRAGDDAVLSGRVLSGRDGAAIPGARLRVGIGREVRSDALGRFRIAGIDPSASSVAVVVKASGHGTLATRIDRGGSAPAEIELELAPEGRARGTLAAADGAPLAGAWVVAGGSEVQSAADGRFLLEGLAPGSQPLFFARAQGQAPLAALLPRVAVGDQELGEIRLASSASLSGRVRTRAGSELGRAWVKLEALGPLPDLGGAAGVALPTANNAAGTTIVAIRVAPPVGDAEPAPPTPAPADASPFRNRGVRADSAGRFRIVDLAAGRYRVFARLNGRAPAPAVEIDVIAGEARGDLEILFEDGVAIEGRVRGADGTAIASAWIVPSIDGERTRVPVQLSGLDGHFTLAGLAEADYDLEVSFHGSVGSGESERSYARAFVRGVRAPRADLEVIMPLDLYVEGVLVDEAMAPIAGVYVESCDPDGRRDNAATDASGRFRVRAAEGTTVELRVRGPVLRDAADIERARTVPRWTGELAGVPSGSRDVLLRAAPER